MTPNLVKNRMTPYFKRIILIVAILFSCIGCDQMTKTIAKDHLPQARPISYLGDTFRLQYMENKGAFLGFGSTLPAEVRFWVLFILTGIAVTGMLVFVLLRHDLHRSLVVGLSLVIGGGVGNLIDRAFRNGAVVDFMNIGVGSLRTGIFNVADVAIMLGMMLIVVGAQRRTRQW